MPSLIDERFDHDSCGVGFVASIQAAPTHNILKQALTALGRLAHRGATAADGKSSDGVGIMAGVPRVLLLREAGLTLDANAEFGVGMIFIPQEETRAEALIERCLTSQDLKVLGWRDVPIKTEYLGEMALSTMPKIRQVFVTEADGAESGSMERRLYLARKQFERAHERGDVDGYVCSLSTQTIVYKAMCTGSDLSAFYPDLASEDYVTPFAIFHQRYATNTLPTWHRAQPGRTLGHNGEINTVWGNRARMAARDATLPVECKPVLTQGGTDSTSLDEAVELISHNGRTLAEAMRMVMPPSTLMDRDSSFLRYHADCTEPWDGPAAIAFANGKLVGAVLDRNGLRPCRFA
ncbi:MAG TPA: glutamate synthase large subunit, partial [Edaphobacter sp.]